ncbi:Phox homologous domain [Plasmopara halstedii]|uniref:Phox homologous domain n=1 Tax=Plasmopara halstedii TaxID=4781 RepID=A0A0P1B320_PLAHL|nr:Phox homologous domain [Plasmopara halstedii]CEG48649.1 Phox homologous domain [Plasmopara halstedii]|eukprot:XP_024585018.1 Phox homologous domain [Plasmopara halstedii]
MQPSPDIKKPRARTVRPENAKPTIVLSLPGVRFAVFSSALDSLQQFDVTLSSTASLLFVTYITCVVAWNILSIVVPVLAHTAWFALITFYTFVGITSVSTTTVSKSDKIAAGTYYTGNSPMETDVTASKPTLPLLSVIPSTLEANSNKADRVFENKQKNYRAPTAQRRVLARLNKNRILVNVVPGETRRRVDMNLGEANFRVGKAFVQSVSGKRKPRDIYVIRVDCGAKSASQEKHMNPVIMWDVTATFDEFKQLERDLKKELKARNLSTSVKLPHLSSGSLLFLNPELTNHVLNARRVRLQTFIDSVKSDPILSSMGCLRKFCQAY